MLGLSLRSKCAAHKYACLALRCRTITAWHRVIVLVSSPPSALACRRHTPRHQAVEPHDGRPWHRESRRFWPRTATRAARPQLQHDCAQPVVSRAGAAVQLQAVRRTRSGHVVCGLCVCRACRYELYWGLLHCATLCLSMRTRASAQRRPVRAMPGFSCQLLVKG